jgi:hypothetical protein
MRSVLIALQDRGSGAIPTAHGSALMPNFLMLALMGHMSRSMLERYSHIRMTAKRDAVAGVTLSQKGENSEVVPVEVPVVEQPSRIQ